MMKQVLGAAVPVFLVAVFFVAPPAWAQPTSENNSRLKKGLKDYPEADTDGDGVLTLKEALALSLIHI